MCYSYILSLLPSLGSWLLSKHFLQICLSPWKIRNNISQRDTIKPCPWDSKTSRLMTYFSMTKGLISSSSLQAIILWSTSHSKSQKSYWNWKVKALCGEWPASSALHRPTFLLQSMHLVEDVVTAFNLSYWNKQYKHVTDDHL